MKQSDEKEYVFDVKLWASVRVVAANRREAWAAVTAAVECAAAHDAEVIEAIKQSHKNVRLTEFSICAEDEGGENAVPVEINEVATDTVE